MTNEEMAWRDIADQGDNVIDIVDQITMDELYGKTLSQKTFYKLQLQAIGMRASMLRTEMKENRPHESLMKWLGLEGPTWWHVDHSALIEDMLARRFCGTCGNRDCNLWIIDELSIAPKFIWSCEACSDLVDGVAQLVDPDWLETFARTDKGGA